MSLNPTGRIFERTLRDESIAYRCISIYIYMSMDKSFYTGFSCACVKYVIEHENHFNSMNIYKNNLLIYLFGIVLYFLLFESKKRYAYIFFFYICFFFFFLSCSSLNKESAIEIKSKRFC